ncbi:MAG: GAF domain-containing protein [Myxococcota bacterium]|nr:GAF domain-containing protein [Myxococcota bacterium]
MQDGDGREASRSHEVLALLQRGAESANELLGENERLRSRIAELEEQGRPAASGGARHGYEAQAALRASARGTPIDQRLRELEDENRQLAERHVQLEEVNTQLVNLYVASSQLHSTLELTEVLRIITEIVVNLVGAEKLAVYAVDERTNTLSAVAVEGAEPGELPKYDLGEGVVGSAAASGEVYFQPDGDPSDPERPLVCIPLRMRDRAIGAVVIYRLLEHKPAFTARDHELFRLLGEHAATALLAAQLYLQSRRKLDLFQGLCDLLVK